MAIRVNEQVADQFDEVARLLNEQGGNTFRVHAYQRAADTLRELPRSVGDISAERGLDGLKELPGIGDALARAISDVLQHGHLPMLERLRGESDPVKLLSTLPGIGPVLARRLYEELGVGSLEELEAAAHESRLKAQLGIGDKRLAGIRDALAQRLGRRRPGSHRCPNCSHSTASTARRRGPDDCPRSPPAGSTPDARRGC